MHKYIKIMIVRAILYCDDFFITLKSAARFVRYALGLVYSPQRIGRILKGVGLTLSDVRVLPHRLELRALYDALLWVY